MLVPELIRRHAPHGLLIDTNVLLLYLVGSFSTEFIERFKRTRSRGYTAEDFVLVANLARLFARVVTMPHILAELSNLSMQIESPHLTAHFRCVVGFLRAAREECVTKDTILLSPRLALLPKIGITDLSIIEAAKRGKYLVLTDDLNAAIALRSALCGVINLNEIRGELWLSQ